MSQANQQTNESESMNADFAETNIDRTNIDLVLDSIDGNSWRKASKGIIMPILKAAKASPENFGNNSSRIISRARQHRNRTTINSINICCGASRKN